VAIQDLPVHQAQVDYPDRVVLPVQVDYPDRVVLPVQVDYPDRPVQVVVQVLPVQVD
jgi:hypothetical protein